MRASSRRVLRIVLLIVAVAGLGWSGFRLYSALPQISLLSVASGIGAGETYKQDALLALEPNIAATQTALSPNPDVLRSVAIIRIREAEEDLNSGQLPSTSTAFERASTAVLSGIEASPTDPFLWYGSAWLRKSRYGYDAEVASRLKLSYDMGPNEGWVAVHRNGFTLTLLSALPSEFQTTGGTEFRGLVESNYIADAATVLTGPGWSNRSLLLASVEAASEAARIKLSKRLEELGFGVAVPGVETSPARPWK